MENKVVVKGTELEEKRLQLTELLLKIADYDIEDINLSRTDDELIRYYSDGQHLKQMAYISNLPALLTYAKEMGGINRKLISAVSEVQAKTEPVIALNRMRLDQIIEDSDQEKDWMKQYKNATSSLKPVDENKEYEDYLALRLGLILKKCGLQAPPKTSIRELVNVAIRHKCIRTFMGYEVITETKSLYRILRAGMPCVISNSSGASDYIVCIDRNSTFLYDSRVLKRKYSWYVKGFGKNLNKILDANLKFFEDKDIQKILKTLELNNINNMSEMIAYLKKKKLITSSERNLILASKKSDVLDRQKMSEIVTQMSV